MPAQNENEALTNAFSQRPHLGVMHHEDLSKNFDPDQLKSVDVDVILNVQMVSK